MLVPFSLMWGGFAIFWNAMVWFAPADRSSGGGPDWFFKLWGLPFLIIGLYMIAGRFIHDAQIRKKMFYAISDHRVLILRGSKLTSLDIHRLPRLELTEHGSGSGTVAFEAGNSSSFAGMNGFSGWLPALGTGAQFYRIENARKVYELARDAARARS